MTPTNVLGVLVLLVASVIALMELLFWSDLRAELRAIRVEPDDRPDTTPAPYVVGSESDPFAVKR